MDMKDIVAKYIKLRDLKSRLDGEHKERIAPIVAAMDSSEAAILALFNEMGLESAGCEAGTAYISTKSSATVVDMEAFLGFVKANDAWHMLERRVAKTTVDEYVTAHNDLPPGINYSSIKTINVRRAS